MADSLKSANRVPLLTVMAANLAIFVAAMQTDAILGGDWLGLAKIFVEALPAGLGLIFIGILNSQLSPEAKARIIFSRWRNPLPGSEAFSRYAPADPRIDVGVLESNHGSLPSSPAEQNKLWYKIYKSVETDASVQQVHQEFLFTRDYACLSLMMVPLLGAAGFLQIPSIKTAAAYLALLILQFVLAWRAARNSGRRFVTNVLAIKGAS